MTNPLTVASLFAGAGGMDIGFHNAGFEIAWANDIDADACSTHRLWSESEVVCKDISNLSPSKMPRTDIITGGFPCQGFSLAGPRQVDDSRNILYRHFVECVDYHHPMAFIAENVKGILTLGNGEIIQVIKREFADKGYTVSYELVNAVDYRVPQDRQRVIMVGILSEIAQDFIFPVPHAEIVTMKDAIGFLPTPDEKDICCQSFSSRYMSRNRRRDWHCPSFTIPAMAKQVPLHPSSPAMSYVDVDKWEFGEGCTRRLSWIEAALIQTFPEGMTFCGDLMSKYKQIGNAVPPKLSKTVAVELKRRLR